MKYFALASLAVSATNAADISSVCNTGTYTYTAGSIYGDCLTVSGLSAYQDKGVTCTQDTALTAQLMQQAFATYSNCIMYGGYDVQVGGQCFEQQVIPRCKCTAALDSCACGGHCEGDSNGTDNNGTDNGTDNNTNEEKPECPAQQTTELSGKIKYICDKNGSPYEWRSSDGDCHAAGGFAGLTDVTCTTIPANQHSYWATDTYLYNDCLRMLYHNPPLTNMCFPADTTPYCSCSSPSTSSACNPGSKTIADRVNEEDCVVTFPGGPDTLGCYEAAGVTPGNGVKCWTSGQDECKCQKEVPDVEEECDNNNCPVTWTGGPTPADCREEAKVPAARDDIICEVINGDTCKCDKPVTDINVPELCDNGECPYTYPGGPKVSDCRRKGKVNDLRSDINCVVVGSNCRCDFDNNGGNSGPYVPEECKNGNCPITFPGGPDEDACKAKGHVYDADDTIQCTVSGGACTCNDDKDPTTDGPDEEEYLDVPAICDAGNCPKIYPGGPRVVDCRRKGHVNDQRSDITCVVIGDNCKCDFDINLQDEIDNGKNPITFPGPTTPTDFTDSHCLEILIADVGEPMSKNFNCIAQNGQCNCSWNKDVVEECAQNNCPINFNGGENPTPLSCRKLGKVPDHRTDISCSVVNGQCSCDIDNDSGVNVPDQCDGNTNENCPVTFPGGPYVDNCYIQGHIVDDATRERLNCVVIRNECRCDEEGGENGNSNNNLGPNVPSICDKNECPITFPGGPTIQDCLSQGQVSATRNDITCSVNKDKCICDKALSVVEECDSNRCPVSFPGGPNAIDCRRQADVPFDRLDITCWFNTNTERCECDIEKELPQVLNECAKGNCPISFPGGPTANDCLSQGSVPNNQYANIECTVNGDVCTCDESALDVVKEIDEGRGPVEFEGANSAYACRNLAEVPYDRLDISCEFLNNKCVCYKDLVNEIPNVVEECDNKNCPVTFIGGPKAKHCRRQGSVPPNRKDIKCTVSGGNCTCDCPTCNQTIPTNVVQSIDNGEGPITWTGAKNGKICRRMVKIPKNRKDIICSASAGVCTCKKR